MATAPNKSKPTKQNHQSTSKMSTNKSNSGTKKESAHKEVRKKDGAITKTVKKTGKTVFGLVKFIITLTIILAFCAGIFYGWKFYEEYQKAGGDTNKAFENTKAQATNDLTKAKEKSKEYSKTIAAKSTEWSAAAFENSEEYLKLAKDFTKDSFADLSEKMKKIGEKSPKELMNSADDYLKEFMSGSEMKEIEPSKVASTPESNSLANNTTKPVNNTDTHTQTPQEQPAHSIEVKSEPEKQKTVELSKNTEIKMPEPTKSGFVTPEKPVEEKPIIKTEEAKVEEPKKKGFTMTKSNAGEKNEGAIKKPAEEQTKAVVTEKPQAQKPPHMKTYEEGRGYFLQGLDHYKKQMPGMPNENLHRKQAYILFKKAEGCFVKVEKQMEGNEEYERISVDNQRFMFGCGKSMLIDKH